MGRLKPTAGCNARRRRRYCLDDQIGNYEVGGACGTYGGEEQRTQRVSVGKPEGKRQLGRPRHRRKANNNQDLI
jgi:hypothetical protein